MEPNYPLLGVVMALALGLTEVTKAVITKIARNGNGASWDATDATRLHQLHRWHAPSDDGRQDWKNPEIRDLLKEIRDSLHRMEKK